MKWYQSILLGIAVAFSSMALGAIIWSDEVLPMLPQEEVQEYMRECIDKGGWSASSGYISQERVLHVCYGRSGGQEVVLDVTYR